MIIAIWTLAGKVEVFGKEKYYEIQYEGPGGGQASRGKR